VIQAGICEKAQTDVFARRLSSALMVPIKFGENEIVATVSVGISLAPSDGTDPERLLKSADLALYNSKADGRNCIRLFDAMQARTELERTLRDARPP
jgi:diguanylate cyclase (GGDEF)-like protein